MKIVVIETGETVEEYTLELVGQKVRVVSPDGTLEDWVEEVWCPICEASCIGTRSDLGGFLARHMAWHNHDAATQMMEA